jgi:hypothetical protein
MIILLLLLLLGRYAYKLGGREGRLCYSKDVKCTVDEDVVELDIYYGNRYTYTLFLYIYTLLFIHVHPTFYTRTPYFLYTYTLLFYTHTPLLIK